ncbi:hypothetical protein ACFRQM_42150 [Streptomyces sp. NPDC056831]|uniref:hypothetical protein n=1 Tax=Streptomyces sp. NPDC056831 TaxID=3345954 RepID=UPI0036B15F20
MPIALVKRLEFCDCSRLVLDGHDLTRNALSTVTASMTACQDLVLATIDYAHRTFGCAGLSALLHELTDKARATLSLQLSRPFWTASVRRTGQRTVTQVTTEAPTQ